MIYRTIPGTDLKVSKICLGTADMGSGAMNTDRSFEILDAYVEAGGNFLDTAHVYGDWVPGEKSLSEKMIGKWLKDRGMYGKVTIATKGAHPRLSSMKIPRLSSADITVDVEESLEYLKTDCIDLYYLHRDDLNRSVDEIIESLNEHIKKGNIKYIGCSNWKPDRIKAANEYAAIKGLKPFVVSEILWSLAVPNKGSVGDPTIAAMDDEAYGFHMATGMAVTAFTSQARGFFTKVAANGLDSVKDWVKNTYYSDINMGRLERVKELASDLSVSITQIVLAYIASHPFVGIPITAPQSVEQFEDCIKAGDVELTPEMVKYLEIGE